VFGLGCLLYQCITGFAPFGGGYWVSVRLKVLLSEPPPLNRLRPDVPLALSSLVERMLAKDPAQRPDDGSEVARELVALAPMRGSERRVSDPYTSISGHSLAKPTGALDAKYLVLALCDDDDDEPPATVEQAVWSRRMRSLEEAIARYGAVLDFLWDGSAVATLSGDGDRANSAAECALALRSHLPGFPIRIARIGAHDDGTPPDVSGDIDNTVNLLVKAAVTAVFEDTDGGAAIRVDPTVAARIEERFVVTRKGPDFILLGPRPGSEP
jgi:hypothetical protein